MKSKAKYHQSSHTFCINSETEGISKPIHDPAPRNRCLTVAMTPGVHAPWSPCAFSQRAVKAGTDSTGRASLGHCTDAGRKGAGNELLFPLRLNCNGGWKQDPVTSKLQVLNDDISIAGLEMEDVRHLSAPAILQELIKYPLSLIFTTFKENQQSAITSYPYSCLELRWTWTTDSD